MPSDFEDEDYSPTPLGEPFLPSGTAATEVTEVAVPLTHAGKRLDQALAAMFPTHSRSRLSQLIKQGEVLVNGETATPKTALNGGERLRVHLLPRDEDLAFRPEEVALEVIHEDPDVVVIDKPAGLVVHPAAGNWSGTILNGLLFRYPETSRVPRAGIVHRLDKDTSGVMVAARTEVAQTALVRQLQARTVKREYLALVRGHPDKGGKVDAPIGRHPRDRVKMTVLRDDQGGKPAVTHYDVIEHYAFHSLIRCRLETGRTHQIRVHMQAIGFPLEGDLVYGPTLAGMSSEAKAAIRSFGRQALHARKLAFVHPVSNAHLEFEAPVAEDMREFIEAMAAL